MIDEREFNILNYLRIDRNDRVDLRCTAMRIGCTLQELTMLVEKRLVNQCCQLEEAGLQELEPYRVRNAVIMAAGLSSRFAPLCYETPKGLLKVKGQILIERQIEQLLEAGISEIYVVVGYMKEKFYYLSEKYPVTLVENKEYMSRNNNGSIYQVREILDNTYILSSDNYFSENIFEPYIYHSYYAVQYQNGSSTERGVEIDGAGNILRTFPNGRDCWVLLGQVYWDRAFSRAFLNVLESVYHRRETRPLLWERIFDQFIDVLPTLSARRYENVIFEFDSLDELRQFDRSYVDYMDSTILKHISSVLNTKPGDLANFQPIKGGLTNQTFTFSCGGVRYIYRYCSAYTRQIVDRKREAQVQKIANHIGLDSTCLYLDPESGWKLSRFVEGVPANFGNRDHIDQVIRALRLLHDSGAECAYRIDFMEEIKKAHALLRDAGVPAELDQELFQMICRLYQRLCQDNWPLKLCHNDVNGGNFLLSSGRCDLIDWEYAGMNDIGYDIAKLVLKSGARGRAVSEVIGKYYGRPCTKAEKRHIVACGAIEDYYWMVWGLFQAHNGKNMENDISKWRENALEYGKMAMKLYQS